MARKRGSATDFDTFEVGDQVRHSKWGVGSILFKSGSADSAKAIVVFPEEGQKKLMLKYAKLERIQDSPDADDDEFGLAAEAPAASPAKEKEEKEEDEEEVALDLPVAAALVVEEEEEEEYDDDDDDDEDEVR
jgi:hypothetical protein